MKKRGSFIFILVLTTAFLFYRAGSLVAMASEQIAGPTAGPEADDESAVETEPETENGSAAETEPETDGGSAAGTESETDSGSAVETEPEADGGSAAEPEPGLNDESAVGTEPETDGESAVGAEPEPGQNADHAIERESVRIMGSAVLPEPEESVSTGPALVEWLESHKNTGGTVRLADHVTLDGEYCYCPDGLNMPAVFVDTDQYTITVTGMVEFISDNHLTFSGRPDGKGIFYVAEKGMLSMQGITVESETRALWQEEGAGLAVSDCRTAGSIHYAEKPFVVEPDPVCVVVERGRTVNDALPECLRCRVNRQGEISSDDSVPLVWNLEGTERQQEERLRFQAQGVFSQAASAEPVRCTVVYNDYPLTFEEVRASMYGNCYIFKGWYTMPKEESPYTLISEYSFDAENWFVSNEAMVDGTYADFVIVVDDGRFDRAAHPYIYIRLQRNDNGTRYFSNVLCYAADNLDCVEDIGGSRGGGTSIIDPPDELREETGDSSPEEESLGQKPNPDTQKTAKSKTPAKTGKAKEETDLFDSTDGTENDVSSGAYISGGNEEQPLDAETASSDAKQELYAAETQSSENSFSYTDTESTESETDDNENIGRGNYDASEKEETVVALSAYEENGEPLSHMGESVLRAESRRANYLMIAAGFVLLSAFAGAAGFYVRSGYSHSGTKR